MSSGEVSQWEMPIAFIVINLSSYYLLILVVFHYMLIIMQNNMSMYSIKSNDYN